MPFSAGVEAKKTPGVFSPKGPSGTSRREGAPQKRHRESFSPHRSLADKRFPGASQNG